MESDDLTTEIKTPEIKTLSIRDYMIEKGAALHFGRMKEAAHARRHWAADIPAGTYPDVVLKPSYWAHMVQYLKPLDLIEAFCEDGAWESLLRVMFVGQAEVRVSQVYRVIHEKIEDVNTDLYVIAWKGPAAKFAVVNKDNGKIVRDHLYPKGEALAFLRDHLLKMKV